MFAEERGMNMSLKSFLLSSIDHLEQAHNLAVQKYNTSSDKVKSIVHHSLRNHIDKTQGIVKKLIHDLEINDKIEFIHSVYDLGFHTSYFTNMDRFITLLSSMNPHIEHSTETITETFEPIELNHPNLSITLYDWFIGK